MGEKGPGRAALSSGGSPSSGTALALPDPFPVLPAGAAGIAGRCQGRASARAATSGIWSEAEGIFRSEQGRARATCGKNLPGVHSCAGRSSLRAHIPVRIHPMEPLLARAQLTLTITPAQLEWGPFPLAFSNCFVTLLIFQSHFCHVKSFLLEVVSSPPSSASKGRTRGQKNGLDLKSRCPKHPQPQPGCSWSWSKGNLEGAEEEQPVVARPSQDNHQLSPNFGTGHDSEEQEAFEIGHGRDAEHFPGSFLSGNSQWEAEWICGWPGGCHSCAVLLDVTPCHRCHQGQKGWQGFVPLRRNALGDEFSWKVELFLLLIYNCLIFNIYF